MNPEYDRAPDATNTRGGSGLAGTSTIPRNPDFPRIPGLGCPAGCPLGLHTCGVGEPLPDLPPIGPRERGGRDLTIDERDAIAGWWRERRYVA